MAQQLQRRVSKTLIVAAQDLGLTTELTEQVCYGVPGRCRAVLTTIPIVGRRELESEPRSA